MRTLSLIIFFLSFLLLSTLNAVAVGVTPYTATPDQVLVLYNSDSKGEDSKEIAEYYARMHADPVSGRRPYVLGLHCRHKKNKHLNNWYIKEVSNDNVNGIVLKATAKRVAYKGKKPSSHASIIRDLRHVRIELGLDVDLDSISLSIRSELTKEKKEVVRVFTGDAKGYYIAEGKQSKKHRGSARALTLDASRFFSGEVTVFFTVKNNHGKIIKDFKLRYYDRLDYEFSPTGADGIADDKILEEDVLTPVREFLEDPANAAPGGVLLKDHILYIVVVRGMPYSAKAVFGIARGATSKRSDHGARGSLEQRLQTLYYDWPSPPVVAMQVKKGPDSNNGVQTRAITTAMRRPQAGRRWNPYMHKNAYSYTRRGSRSPEFYNMPPLRIYRELLPAEFFAYGVTRIDGASARDAKRIIDYALYATKYLRPEMDCRVRAALAKKGEKEITDLSARMRKVEDAGLWGAGELSALGFITQIDKTNYKDHKGQGVPFLVRPTGEDGSCAQDAPADWRVAGFYPGGMHRYVMSNNGLNYSRSVVWKHLRKGVTVTAAGAPAYGGGPHITNATFWDNRILMRYLLRGRDMGEALLNSILYVNWSNSIIADPLMHPDLAKTVIDTTPPELEGELSVEVYTRFKKASVKVVARLRHDSKAPEVALLKVTLVGADGEEVTAVSPLYSARPELTVKGLKARTEYGLRVVLIDPYGNKTELDERRIKTKGVNYPASILRKIVDDMK